MSALPPESGQSKIAQFRERRSLQRHPRLQGANFSQPLLLNKPISRQATHVRPAPVHVSRAETFFDLSVQAHAAL
jgi:hypothetical protein